MTAERDESKENRDAVTSVPFRYALSSALVGVSDRRFSSFSSSPRHLRCRALRGEDSEGMNERSEERP